MLRLLLHGGTLRCTPSNLPRPFSPGTPSSCHSHSPSPFLPPLQRTRAAGEMPGGRVHLSTHRHTPGISNKSGEPVPGPRGAASGRAELLLGATLSLRAPLDQVGSRTHAISPHRIPLPPPYISAGGRGVCVSGSPSLCSPLSPLQPLYPSPGTVPSTWMRSATF